MDLHLLQDLAGKLNTLTLRVNRIFFKKNHSISLQIVLFIVFMCIPGFFQKNMYIKYKSGGEIDKGFSLVLHLSGTAYLGGSWLRVSYLDVTKILARTTVS